MKKHHRLIVTYITHLLGLSLIGGAVEMNPEKVLTLTIAKQGITRISVEGDKIVDTYVDPQEVAGSLKNNRGHLYLSGQSTIPAVYISLITKTGIAQDLKLVFKETSPKPILLKAPSVIEEGAEGQGSTETTLSWLRSFLKGQVPPVFKEVPLPTNAPSRTHGTITAVPTTLWHHPEGYVVTAYRLSTPEPLSLKADVFQQPGDRALVCSTQRVEPDHEATLYVLSHAMPHVASSTLTTLTTSTQQEISHD